MIVSGCQWCFKFFKYFINLVFFSYSFFTNSAHGKPCKNSFLFIIYIAYIMSIIIIKENILHFFFYQYFY